MGDTERITRLSETQKAAATKLLRIATTLQGAFWDALFELEQALGVDIDANRDLSEWDVESLHECVEDDAGRPASWLAEEA